MPSSMTHLLCAKILAPDKPTRFFVGSVSPDCIDVREYKDRTHFRDIPIDTRLDALRKMARSLDLTDDYLYAVVYHLFADYTWDTGPQQLHRDLYKGDNWFPDYRFAINECGREIYHRYDWAKTIWDEMAKLDKSEYDLLPEYPADEIYAFILRGRDRQLVPLTKPSEIFTPELVDKYAAETAERFVGFMKTV